MQFIDPDGRLILNYSAAQLKEQGLTKKDMGRFEQVVNNLYNMYKDNTQALQVISKSTGFSVDRVKNDLQGGKGPNVIIDNTIPGAMQGDSRGVLVQPGVIKQLAAIDPGDKAALQEQVYALGVTLGHEYTHYGDETTNGRYTGEQGINGSFGE